MLNDYVRNEEGGGATPERMFRPEILVGWAKQVDDFRNPQNLREKMQDEDFVERLSDLLHDTVETALFAEYIRLVATRLFNAADLSSERFKAEVEDSAAEVFGALVDEADAVEDPEDILAEILKRLSRGLDV